MLNFQHQSVLPEEAISYLNIKPEGIYIDATLGGAGHALRICQKLDSNGTLVGIDQDHQAMAIASERLQGVRPQLRLVKSNFSQLLEILRDLEITTIDGIIFDLGVSSPQLDQDERGFSYQHDAPLDMRMDQSQPFSAAHLVNTASVAELSRIIWEYGEERWSKRIAQWIDKYRRNQEITTTGELVEIIKAAIPAAVRRGGPHPARRTFQALRIAVNRELEVLKTALEAALTILKPGGRVVVISFHSLEDRVVKTTFAHWAQGCRCPKEVLICRCNNQPQIRVLTRKPVLPTKEETEQNRRSRSAKLRAAEKLV